MDRITGSTTISLNVDVLASGPWDARSIIPYYSGLTDNVTLPYPYEGMVVTVYNDIDVSKNGIYYCTFRGTNIPFANSDAAWEKVGSGEGTLTGGTVVNNKISGATISGYTQYWGEVDSVTGGYLSAGTLYLTGTGFLSTGTSITGFGTLTSNPFTGGTSSAGTGGTTALTATLVVSGQTTGTTIDLENVLTFTNESTTKRQVGGIPSGSLLFQSGKTIHQILQEIFYPVDSPTINDITAGLSRNSGGGGFSSFPYQIVGTTGSITLSSLYTSGTSQVGSNVSTYRTTGPVSAFTYSGPAVNNGTVTQLSTSNTNAYSLSATPYTVVLGNNTWTGSISYNTGQQPVDDSFQPYNDADTVQFTQPGTKLTNSVIIEGVYPISATTTAGLVDYIQQPLISMVNSSNISITLPNEIDANYKQRFILPDQLKTALTSFQLYNGTTGNYDTVPITDFATISPFGTLTINGNSVTYLEIPI